MKKLKVNVGDIYWDCAYHPVLCTESYRVKNRGLFSYNHDVAGVSLFDGTMPRACSVEHCGLAILSGLQVGWLITRRDKWLDAESRWQRGEATAYEDLLYEWNEYISNGSGDK